MVANSGWSSKGCCINQLDINENGRIIGIGNESSLYYSNLGTPNWSYIGGGYTNVAHSGDSIVGTNVNADWIGSFPIG